MKKILKKIISTAMAITMIFIVSQQAGKEGLNLIIKSHAENLQGICGENVTWEYNFWTKILTVSGTGDMYNYKYDPSPIDRDWPKKVVIEPGVTSIGERAFANNLSVEEVVIPDTVKRIGKEAFYGCCLMEKTVKIPDSITVIEDFTFSSCAALKGVILPKNLISIGQAAFSGNSITNIDIPKSVKRIGPAAFRQSQFANVNIPANVEYIGADVFGDCPNLKSITVDKKNKFYDSRNNCNAIINSSTNELVSGCVTTIIPDTVSVIGRCAICCQGITELVIPEGVTKLCERAIYDDDLRSITIPSTVAEIERGALVCQLLKEVFFTGTREQWNNVKKTDANFENKRVYCRGEKIMYTVTYYGETLNSDTVEKGSSLVLPKPKGKWGPFLGWTDIQDSKVIKYKAGDEITVNNDITLYSIWGPAYGDVNNDQRINSQDALLILQYTVELVKPDEIALVSADVNKDSLINSIDALRILQYSVDIIRVFE